LIKKTDNETWGDGECGEYEECEECGECEECEECGECEECEECGESNIVNNSPCPPCLPYPLPQSPINSLTKSNFFAILEGKFFDAHIIAASF
jgi:hypothetical protein